MEFVPALALLALVKKFGDFLKGITNRDWNSVVTQLVVWAAAWAALAVAAHTAWAAGISIGDTSLADLNGWSQLFVALTIGSGASLVHDTTKAVDNSAPAATSAAIYKPLTNLSTGTPAPNE